MSDPRSAVWELLVSGESVAEDGGWSTRVWLGVGGEVFLATLNANGLTSAAALEGPSALPPAIPGWVKAAGKATQEAKLRAAIGAAQQALKAARWVAVAPDRWLVTSDQLGWVSFYPESEALYHARTPLQELITAFWNDPDVLELEPELDVRARGRALIGAIEGELEAISTGGALFGRVDGERGEATLRLDGRWLAFSLDAEHHPSASTLANPWTAVQRHDEVVRALIEARREAWRGLRVLPIPAGLEACFEALRAGFKTTKEEHVERYIARLRAGEQFSGGPTTDQSWTLRAVGDGFVIDGYEGMSLEELERVSNPIGEAEVRDMFRTYRMFGLSNMPD